MHPLNPTLFAALQKAFGSVLIANEGVPMTGTYTRDETGRLRFRVGSAGEYYRVRCCFCGDTKGKLWINHRWGVRDSVTKTRHRWAAICHRRDCLREEKNRNELIRMVAGYARRAGAGGVAVPPVHQADLTPPQVPLPDDFVWLDQLPWWHSAHAYLRQRRFDPFALSRDWGVGYSASACGWYPEGMLVSPVFDLDADGEAVVYGWQARAFGEDYFRSKYYTPRDMKKSLVLYGSGLIPKDRSPVVVVEGITDAWRYGPGAVALFGKVASKTQRRLLVRLAAGRPLAVLLDPDAAPEARELADLLATMRRESLLRPDASKVAFVPLTGNRDPGESTTEELRSAVLRACES